MQFSAREILNILPPNEWQDGWTLQGSCWGSAQTDSHGMAFITLGTPGDLTLATEACSWSFHISPPRHAVITHCLMLLNGFIIAGHHGDTSFATACFVVEPGVLRGMSTTSMLPRIFSHSASVDSTDTEQFLATAQGHVLCSFDASLYGTSFCLVAGESYREELAKKSATYLEDDFNALLTRELSLRSRFLDLETMPDDHTKTTLESIEFLARQLQPANAALPCRWSNCGEDALCMFDLNTLFPLVETWREIDEVIAQELMYSALAAQQENGMIPAWINETGATADIACLPLVAQAAASIHNVIHNPEFLAYVLPRLIHYLTWAFDNYDITHDGRFSWPSAEESFIPETYYPNVTAVDLITFTSSLSMVIISLLKFFMIPSSASFPQWGF